MNVFKHLYYLRHDYNFLNDLLDYVRHFKNSFLGHENWVKIVFNDSINDLKSVLD
jgi:hypothetical protein